MSRTLLELQRAAAAAGVEVLLEEDTGAPEPCVACGALTALRQGETGYPLCARCEAIARAELAVVDSAISAVEVAPALYAARAWDEGLWCLTCEAHGHACVAEAVPPRPGASSLRLFVERRGGPLLARPVAVDETPFAEELGTTCGGCGCAQLAACPEGCWWTRDVRRVALPEHPAGWLPLCSACVIEEVP